VTVELEIASAVAAPPVAVWAVIARLGGVNDELRPWCTMRGSASLHARGLESWVPGERASCWLLAGGVLPFDRHHFGFESIEPGVGFVEESTSWQQRRWRHQRTLTEVDGGTLIADHLTIEPRLRPAEPLVRWIVGRLFAHRHRRLAERFGAVRPPARSTGPAEP